VLLPAFRFERARSVSTTCVMHLLSSLYPSCRNVCAALLMMGMVAMTVVHQPDQDLNGTQYCVLEQVGRARAAGIIQSKLAKELSIDQRSLFHYIKQLRLFGMVDCQIVMLKEGKVQIKTNMLRLTRYVGQISGKVPLRTVTTPVALHIIWSD